ncbi:Jouberin, partial [Clarias magur]
HFPQLALCFTPILPHVGEFSVEFILQAQTHSRSTCDVSCVNKIQRGAVKTVPTSQRENFPPPGERL